MEIQANRSKNRPARGLAAKKLRSHYVLRNWSWDNGERGEPKRAKNRYRADLIETFYQNPATGTKTAHTLTLDLDWDKADPVWLTDGILDASKILEHLRQEEPEIAESITELVKSSSGRGLGVAIAISPIDVYRPAAARISQLANLVQERLIRIFNHYGLGADPAANGLCRTMPNFLNPRKLVYSNPSRRKSVDRAGVPVIQDLLRITNNHSLLKSKDHLLWPHRGVERKLAKIYKHLESKSSCVSMTTDELCEFTGLSRVTALKVLNSPPRWLIVSPRESKFDPWELWLHPKFDLLERAEELLSGPVKLGKRARYCLDMPDQVEKGYRNKWVKTVCLILKWTGTSQADAERIMEALVKLVPQWQTSNSCKRFLSILRSIYCYRPNYRREILLPDWLFQWLRDWNLEKTKKRKKGFIPKAQPPQAKSEAVGLLNSGEVRVGSVKGARVAKVGEDQRLYYKGRYYSVPGQWVRFELLVFEAKGSVYIVKEQTSEEWLRGVIKDPIAWYPADGKSHFDRNHYPDRSAQAKKVESIVRGTLKTLKDSDGWLISMLTEPLELLAMPVLSLRRLRGVLSMLRATDEKSLRSLQAAANPGAIPRTLRARLNFMSSVIKGAT